MECDKQDLKGKFKTALEKADSLRKESIAFPALGASIDGYTLDGIAESLYDALISFDKTRSFVKEVHIIIFEEEKVSKFKDAMDICLHRNKQGFFTRFKYWTGCGFKEEHSKRPQWRVTDMPQSILCLVIFAKEQKDLNLAIRSFEDSMECDFKEKIIENNNLKELTSDQKDKIIRLQTLYDVEIELRERIGRIIIRGLMDNASDAMDQIYKILNDVGLQKIVADMVQWYFISVEDTGQKLLEYPPEVNLILEKALKNNDRETHFYDSDGNKYVVNLDTYQEFPENDPEDKVAVLRKSKLSDFEIDMPSNWVPMDKTENIKIYVLPHSDREYQTVLRHFNTEMNNKYNSIIKIEKIQNRTLHQQYEAKKKHMESSNRPDVENERILWHGTALEAVDSINTYGFNRSYCGKNAVAFGNGVYFAVKPSYSAQPQYSTPDPNGQKRIYMCKVLVGEFVKGKGGMKVPPLKPEAAAGHIVYDSVVDDQSDPNIFVIFHDTQAYPEYLIVFN